MKVATFFAAGLALLAIILIGYRYSWTGFAGLSSAANQTQAPKLLWDWLDLLLVPIFLALFAYILTRSQENARIMEATSRNRQTSLQDYLDRMAELLLSASLRGSPQGSEPRIIANALTSTVLPSLDPRRKGEVLAFLKQAGLIDLGSPIIQTRRLDFSFANLYPAWLDQVDLRGADFRYCKLPWASFYGSFISGATFESADLEEANFSHVDLNYTILANADLYNADLREVQLIKADLRSANLSYAKLIDAVLRTADLEDASLANANLQGAYLKYARLIDTDLRDADLTGADLSSSTLWGANLRGAILTDCDLTDAYVTWRQLRKVKTLKGAKLSKYTK